jgi:hypothetical protein
MVDAHLVSLARDLAFACPSKPALVISGRSKDMATRNYFSHDILGCDKPNGGGAYNVLDIMLNQAYNTFRGENIAYNNWPQTGVMYAYGCNAAGSACVGARRRRTPIAIAQQSFMQSAGHRANILGDYDRFGCAPWREGTGPIYYTCLFSKGGPKPVDSSATSRARFATLPPVRLLDTRVANGFERSVRLRFGAHVPGQRPRRRTHERGRRDRQPDVTQQTSAGYVALGPIATNAPSTSSLNFPKSDNRANAVTVQLGEGGKLSAVFKGTSGATAALVFDVTGYFFFGDSGATYVPIDPTRLLDTRVDNGLSDVFVSGTPRTFQVTGRADIPADSVAVTGNLTVSQPSAGGFVTLGPVSTDSPSTSTLNFPAGDTRANGVTVPLGSGGTLSAVLTSASGAHTHLILDVTGYFLPGDGGLTFVPLPPYRRLDTRNGTASAARSLRARRARSRWPPRARCPRCGSRHRKPDRDAADVGGLRRARPCLDRDPVHVDAELPARRHARERGCRAALRHRLTERHLQGRLRRDDAPHLRRDRILRVTQARVGTTSASAAESSAATTAASRARGIFEQRHRWRLACGRFGRSAGIERRGIRERESSLHGADDHAARESGKSRQNRAPRSGSDSAARRPPCATAIRFAR